MVDMLTDKEKETLVFGIHQEQLPAWDKTRAIELAKQQQLTLTDAHFKVLELLRTHYLQHGKHLPARKLSEILDKAFQREGGLKFLYQLFPGGPLSQGSLIAGLPVPNDSQDRSFGTTL